MSFRCTQCEEEVSSAEQLTTLNCLDHLRIAHQNAMKEVQRIAVKLEAQRVPCPKCFHTAFPGDACWICAINERLEKRAPK